MYEENCKEVESFLCFDFSARLLNWYIKNFPVVLVQTTKYLLDMYNNVALEFDQKFGSLLERFI